MSSNRRVQITNTTITKAKRDALKGATFDLTDDSRSGLVLRAGPRGVHWGWRGQHRNRSYRLDLGPVDDWGIDEARQLAHEATRMVRSGRGRPDQEWLHHWRIKLEKAKPSYRPQEDPRLALKWSFKEARETYLAFVREVRREATYYDYKVMLEAEELTHLERRPVGSITRVELAEIIRKVWERRKERRAEKFAESLRPFFGWLGEDAQVRRSGVTAGIMRDLKAPPRRLAKTRPDEPKPVTRQKKPRSGDYCPSMLEVGRIVAIARSGALEPLIGAATELMVFSAQRRRTVVSAYYDSFKEDGEMAGVGYWVIPHSHRKTADMRDDRTTHIVPLSHQAWSAYLNIEELGEIMLRKQGRKSSHIFPQFRPKHVGDELTHMNESVLTRALWLMPKVIASPHDLRTAFTSHLQEARGFSRLECKLILDHNEGIPTGDPTRRYEVLTRNNAKWPIVEAWANLVEDYVKLAVDEDPLLLDVDWLKSQIAMRRYGTDENGTLGLVA